MFLAVIHSPGPSFEKFEKLIIFTKRSTSFLLKYHLSVCYSSVVLVSICILLLWPFMLFYAKSWPVTTHLLLLFFVLVYPLHAIPSIVLLNGTCHDKCGNITLKFPFGSSFGCGHPAFARYIECSSSGTLQFSTGTGTYMISSIDYSSNTLTISDPFMSTCSSMQNSGSFILDHTGPFTVTADNIFVLMGCSTTSPIFDRNTDFCDTGSVLNLCKGLYSCKEVTGIGLEPNAPISTCCVYDPTIVLGSRNDLDLPKLQCSSYSGIYGFGGDEGDPMKWQYGILLHYNDSYVSNGCKNCEDSGGFCGFSGVNESFACICPNGRKSSINCYGRGYGWSGTWRHKIQTKLSIGGFLLLLSISFI